MTFEALTQFEGCFVIVEIFLGRIVKGNITGYLETLPALNAYRVTHGDSAFFIDKDDKISLTEVYDLNDPIDKTPIIRVVL